jgi:hypothetical protein
MSKEPTMTERVVEAMVKTPGLTNPEYAEMLGVDTTDAKAKAGFAVACGRAKKQVREEGLGNGGEATPARSSTTAASTKKDAPEAKDTPSASSSAPASATPMQVGFDDRLLDKTVAFLAAFDDAAEATKYINRVNRLQVKS